jgi:hypothetical protein
MGAGIVGQSVVKLPMDRVWSSPPGADTMSQSPSSSAGDPTGPDRRRYPRFDATGRVVGTLLTVDLPVRIRDIGFGGFAIETVDPVTPGQLHKVRLTTVDDRSVVVEAMTLHCRPSCAPDGSPRYVTGLSFTSPESPETQRAVGLIIESVTSLQIHDA